MNNINNNKTQTDLTINSLKNFTENRIDEDKMNEISESINDEDIKFALFTLAEQIAIQDYANKLVTLAP